MANAETSKNQPEFAGREDLKAAFDRVHEYVFRTGKAICDLPAKVVAIHNETATGEDVYEFEGIQPHNTITSRLTGEQIRRSGPQGAAAADYFKLGDDHEVSFGYSAHCYIQEPDGPVEYAPAQVLMNVKRSQVEEGTRTDVYSVDADQRAPRTMYKSQYEPTFDARPETAEEIEANVQAAKDPQSLIMKTMFSVDTEAHASDEQVRASHGGDSAYFDEAAALLAESRALYSADTNHMLSLFNLIDPKP
jgi:hypothetical protein